MKFLCWENGVLHCAHSETDRNVQNKFRKSEKTESRKSGEVLKILRLLAKEIVRPPYFSFAEIPR
jgi:hypothetical protein